MQTLAYLVFLRLQALSVSCCYCYGLSNLHDLRRTCQRWVSPIFTAVLPTCQTRNAVIVGSVFWDVAPCRFCVNRRFGGTYLTLVPRSWISVLWRWRRYVPPKRWFTQNLHGATSKKTAFFMITAMKTSNRTQWIIVSFNWLICQLSDGGVVLSGEGIKFRGFNLL
jgi:hypothetical protein